MVRLAFVFAFLNTTVAALVLGGALAWRNTELTPRQMVSVGDIDFTIGYVQSGDALVGPNDGMPHLIGLGTVTNTGNLTLYFRSGEAHVFSVPPWVATCRTGHFVGSVVPLLQLGSPGGVAPGTTAHDFEVSMAVAKSASKACQGRTLSYTVSITMGTTPSN
jgi:hypothetical protein